MQQQTVELFVVPSTEWGGASGTYTLRHTICVDNSGVKTSRWERACCKYVEVEGDIEDIATEVLSAAISLHDAVIKTIPCQKSDIDAYMAAIDWTDTSDSCANEIDDLTAGVKVDEVIQKITEMSKDFDYTIQLRLDDIAPRRRNGFPQIFICGWSDNVLPEEIVYALHTTRPEAALDGRLL